jgi:hypothetical protein
MVERVGCRAQFALLFFFFQNNINRQRGSLAEKADYDRVALGVSVLLARLDFKIQQRGWSLQQVFYVAALGAPLHLSWEILSL